MEASQLMGWGNCGKLPEGVPPSLSFLIFEIGNLPTLLLGLNKKVFVMVLCKLQSSLHI